MPHLALILSLLALTATKLADIATTWRGIREHGMHWEQNPLAHRAMARLGLAGGIAVVMALWGVVVAVCFLPAWNAPPWYQWATAAGGLGVACAQWDVAHSNATGRHTWFTRQVLRAYRKWQRVQQ